MNCLINNPSFPLNYKKTKGKLPNTEAYVSNGIKILVKIFIGILLTVAVFLFANARPVLMFNIFNNSGQKIIILIDDEENSLNLGETLRLTRIRFHSRPEIGCDVWKHRPLYTMSMNVKVNDQLWNYEFPVPSRYRYISDEHRVSDFFYCEIKLQINPDGLIYILNDVENPPINDFKKQPKGFPTKPDAGHIIG